MIPTPSFKELQDQYKHFSDDRGPEVVAANITLVILAVIAVALRFWARRISGAKLLSDDWTAAISLIFMIGLGVLGVLSAHYGLGKHAVRVGITNISKFLKAEYIYEQVYCVGVFFTKTSILLFYRRIFHVAKFKLAIYIVWTFVLLWAISTMLAALFQCAPIHYFWDRVYIDGKCFNSTALILATAGTNLLSDCVILVMPMPLVWKLHLPNKQKIALSAIFLLGGFVCIAGAVRIRFLVYVSSTTDPTWLTANGGLWSTVEPCIGLVCANLPVLRPLFISSTSPFASNKKSSGSSSVGKLQSWISRKKDNKPAASSLWASQASTQVSTTAQERAGGALADDSAKSEKPETTQVTQTSRPILWGGKMFRPHKDSRFTDFSRGSAMDSYTDPVEEQQADSGNIHVRSDVEWTSAERSLRTASPNGRRQG